METEDFTRIYNHILDGSFHYKLCRACLQIVEDSVDLFSDHTNQSMDEILIQDIYKEATSIQLTTEDDLPKVLCKECFKNALKAYEFRKMCQASENVLKISLETFIVKQMSKIPSSEVETLLFVLPNKDIVLLETEEYNVDNYKAENKLESYQFETYSCLFCDEIFNNENELKIHIEMHSILKDNASLIHAKNMDYKPKNVCLLCEDDFQSPILLQEHLTSIHGAEIEMYSCTNCKKMCVVNEINETINPSCICDKCGLLIPNEKLETHKNIHNHVKQRKTCIVCNKRYSRETLRNRNFYQNFNRRRRDKIFTCDYCGIDFHLKESLKLHILGKHLNIEPYACRSCGKRFFQIGRLNAHMVVHTRERKNQCDVCGNRFVDGKALKIHQRLHSGERPYPCRFCGDRFISSSRLIAHTKSKHMEKTEECPVCFKKYHLRTCVNQHMIKVHKMVNIRKAIHCDMPIHGRN